jgi:valyl-tRNA synthetase
MHGSSAALPKINHTHLSIYAIEVLKRLNETIDAVENAYREYDFNVVAQRLYDFFWSDYCDWFVEAAKSDIFGDDEARKKTTLAVMDVALAAVLRLLHPLMPHITEELWSMFGFGRGSIQFEPLPEKVDVDLANARANVAAIYEIVQAGRNLRAEARVATNQKAKFAVRSADKMIAAEQATVARLLNASELIIDSKFKSAAGMPVAMTRAGEVVFVLEVDRATEGDRLEKEIAKLEAELKATEAKLNNKSFVDRAPATVVEEHRQRQKNFAEHLAKLNDAREKLR